MVTCYHVIENADSKPIEVFQPKKDVVHAKVKAFCKKRDIAILDLEDYSLYGKDKLEIGFVEFQSGMECKIAGYPQHSSGKSIFICPSFIVAEANIDGVKGYEVNTHIRQGNSGGPLVTNTGKVIGIAKEGHFFSPSGSERSNIAGHNRVIEISEIFKI